MDLNIIMVVLVFNQRVSKLLGLKQHQGMLYSKDLKLTSSDSS